MLIPFTDDSKHRSLLQSCELHYCRDNTQSVSICAQKILRPIPKHQHDKHIRVCDHDRRPDNVPNACDDPSIVEV